MGGPSSGSRVQAFWRPIPAAPRLNRRRDAPWRRSPRAPLARAPPRDADGPALLGALVDGEELIDLRSQRAAVLRGSASGKRARFDSTVKVRPAGHDDRRSLAHPTA